MSAILITGANRGISLELARSFAEDHWRVFACCRNPEQAEELQQLAGENDTISLHRLEVTDRAQIAALAAALKGEAIDILFNNAGIYGPGKQAFGETDAEGWLETFRVNCIAPMLVSEAFVELVAQSKLKIIAGKAQSLFRRRFSPAP